MQHEETAIRFQQEGARGLCQGREGADAGDKNVCLVSALFIVALQNMCRYKIGFCMVSLRKCGFYVRSIECALSLGLGKLAKANSKMACRGILSPEHVTCSVSPLMKKF